jgi:SSS family solute:Na+ symporter
MTIQRWVDLGIVITYLLAMLGVGFHHSKKQVSTESYFVAKRSIPAWALGLSLTSTLVTSLTLIGYPGSAYAKDWSSLLPGLMVPVVLILIGGIVVPFYRHAVKMSAYEYFGRRFGRGVQMYSSFAFSLAHFSKMGFVLYLLALTLNSMTAWNTDHVIVAIGLVTVGYTLAGGLEAVIWVDVIQSFVLWVGVFVSLGYLLFLPHGGPPAVLAAAWENHKFSLGSLRFDLSQPTIIVLVIYGFFWYLQKYTADQTIVQRYLVAKSDRSAKRGVAFGALMCIPAWSVFMLIGSCTWAFYRLTGEPLPPHITKADQVFPYFLTAHLPIGMSGLFLASLVGAAISGLSADMNCLGSVAVADYYRGWKPDSSDRDRLRVGRIAVAGCGVLSIGIALVLAHAASGALSMWFMVSAIASGGLAGLFLLAFCSSRTNRRGIYVGIIAATIFTVWAAATAGGNKLFGARMIAFSWHELMIGAVGNVLLLVVGYAASYLFPGEESKLTDLTIWNWLRTRDFAAREAAAVRPAYNEVLATEREP